MKEYQIVCDRGVVYTDGVTTTSNGVDVGVPPVDYDGDMLLPRNIYHNIHRAKTELRYTRKFCRRYIAKGCKRTYQYNFRIQRREISPWEDVS